MLIKRFFTSVEVKKLKLFSKEGSVYEISYSFSQKKSQTQDSRSMN